MADEAGAMIQMMSVGRNGAEKIVKGSWVIMRSLLKVFLVIGMKAKQRLDLLPGERMMMRFALDGKPLQCLTLNSEQFKIFQKYAKDYGIQYHHINNKKGKKIDNVTLFVPESDAHKFNELVRNHNLNSVENLGTVKAEDVNPHKAADKNELITKSVDENGILSLPEYKNNLIKSGIDPDKADELIYELLDCPELQAFIESGKVKGFDVGDIEFDDRPELVYGEAVSDTANLKDAIGKEAELPNIEPDYVPFVDEGISTRNWSEDRQYFVEQRDTLLQTFKNPNGEVIEVCNRGDIDRIERIIELGDKGELDRIEADYDLTTQYNAIIENVFPWEVPAPDPTSTEPDPFEVVSATETIEFSESTPESLKAEPDYLKIANADYVAGEECPLGKVYSTGTEVAREVSDAAKDAAEKVKDAAENIPGV